MKITRTSAWSGRVSTMEIPAIKDDGFEKIVELRMKVGASIRVMYLELTVEEFIFYQWGITQKEINSFYPAIQWAGTTATLNFTKGATFITTKSGIYVPPNNRLPRPILEDSTNSAY